MQNFFLKHWATVVTANKALCLRSLKKRSRLWLKIHVGIVIALLAWGLERGRGQAVSHVRNIQWETCAKAIPTNKVSRSCFGTFPSIFFLFTSISHLQFCTMTSFIAPCRGIGILESGILGFGKRNTAQGTRNPINDWIHKAIFTTKTWIYFFFSHIWIW